MDPREHETSGTGEYDLSQSLELYADTLLKIAELGDKTQLLEPLESDAYYRIADPRTMPLVQRELPVEYGLDSSLGELREVGIRLSLSNDPNALRTAGTELCLDFSSGTAIVDTDSFGVSTLQGDQSSTGTIEKTNLRRAVSRVLYPSYDPNNLLADSLSEYTFVHEMKEKLSTDEFTSEDEVNTFSLEGYTIQVARTNKKIVDVSLMQPVVDSPGQYMEIQVAYEEHHTTSIKIHMKSTHPEVPLTPIVVDASELQAWRDTAIHLIETIEGLGFTTEDVDALSDKDTLNATNPGA